MAATDKKDATVGIIVDWLERALAAKERLKEAKENGKVDDIADSWVATSELNKTTWLIGLFQIFLIIMFGICGGSELVDENTNSLAIYNMFLGVEVMMFVGFGYLMSFLKWYGLSAIGFTMLVTAVALQWAVLTEAFFDQWMHGYPNWHYVNVNILSLMDALYAVSAVLITFGGIIGKVSPLQLLVITIIELPLHSLNFKVIISGPLSVADMGGTYLDHMFGAYFGLSIAYMLGKPKGEPELGSTPDIFSFIGTTFLWVYWPSFVAGVTEPGSAQQQTAIVNTILTLSSGTIAAFWASSYLGKNGVFRPVDIQNATLAGGVSIGCVANLSIGPVGAICMGIVTSLVSTYGFNVVQPWLEEKGLHDTCGIHNLHGMPSLIGALASIIVAIANKDTDRAIYGEDYADSQWWRQLVGIFATMALAISTGLATGWLVAKLKPPQTVSDFNDNAYWEVADDHGRSLYTELGLVINDGGAMDDKIQALDTSSHHGRRPAPPSGIKKPQDLAMELNEMAVKGSKV